MPCCRYFSRLTQYRNHGEHSSTSKIIASNSERISKIYIYLILIEIIITIIFLSNLLLNLLNLLIKSINKFSDYEICVKITVRAHAKPFKNVEPLEPPEECIRVSMKTIKELKDPMPIEEINQVKKRK